MPGPPTARAEAAPPPAPPPAQPSVGPAAGTPAPVKMALSGRLDPGDRLGLTEDQLDVLREQLYHDLIERILIDRERGA